MKRRLARCLAPVTDRLGLSWICVQILAAASQGVRSSARLQSSGQLLDCRKSLKCRDLAGVRRITVFAGTVLYRTVHSFDMPVRPEVVWFGQPVIDSVLEAEPI